MGIVTTASETAFTHSAETAYDFVTNPENWTKTYPGSAHIGNLPELPRRKRAADPARIDAYHEAVARELSKIDTDTRGA